MKVSSQSLVSPRISLFHINLNDFREEKAYQKSMIVLFNQLVSAPSNLTQKSFFQT